MINYQIPDDPNSQPYKPPSQQAQNNNLQSYLMDSGQGITADGYANTGVTGGTQIGNGSGVAALPGSSNTSTSTASGPYDPRGALSSVFAKYGLDPNNPGHGLANIDYFIQRGGETGGGWGVQSNQDYWQRRTEQEIQKALTGQVGDLIDTGGGSGGGGGASVSNPYSQQATDLYNLLMGKAQQSLNIDPKDPIIANQVNAYNAQNERAGRQYLAQQAEQAGPQGNLNEEQRMVAEKSGQAGGAFQASLMQNELNARRTEIQNALNGAAGFLTDQEKLSLQQQLAQMDNALQYANLGQNAYQFDQNNIFRNSPLGS